MANKPLSIAIIGGGIGGLCLATGLLHHAHLRLSIYEAASAFTEIGAGLALGPNALQALKLISHDAKRAFTNYSTANSSPGYRNTWFDFRCGIRGQHDGLLLGKIENKTGQQTVHRAKFLNELAKLIPEGVAHFGKRLVRIDQPGPDDSEEALPILLYFTDGTTATADCVIGADGIHSTVRKHLLGAAAPAATPIFSGTVAYRGLVPMKVADAALGEYAHNAHLWCGDGGMVMTYPIDFGQVLNVFAARDGKSWDEKEYVVRSTREQLSKDFEGWGEMPRRIIELLDEPTLWAILDHLPAPHYHSGNIAMMGDAAHATTPFQGAGAGQAIEDALVLSALLGKVLSAHDVGSALAVYDAVRRTRTQSIVRTSRDAMKLFAFADGAVNGDAEKWKQVWDGRMDWIWDIDLQKHVADALDLLFQSDDGHVACRGKQKS